MKSPLRVPILLMLLFLMVVFVAASQPATAQDSVEIYINEIQVSTTSTDWEFVELQGAPGTDLSALSLVGVESDTGSLAGTIDVVVDLSGQAIPSDGYWLAISPAGTAAYGESGELSIANNSFENSTATYFLVSGFTGAQGEDLDTDDDGTLDALPWESIVDAVNLRDSTGDFDYGAFSVGPDGTFLPSGTYRCPNAPFGGFDNNILDFNNPDGSPGVANECAPPPPPLTCEDTFDFTAIHDIQGTGAATPLAGQQVIIEGIVVGDFQENDGDLSDLNGFYVQEEEADVDGDPTTSEGVFIFADGMPDVSSGNIVRVVGTAGEFGDQTQISADFYVACGSADLPTATDIELPVAERADLEAYEGMYVRFPQDLVISEYFNFDRFNEIVLGWPTDGTDPAVPNRLFQPTSVFDPGTADAAALADLIARSRITLDDARTASNPDPALHPNGQIFDLDNRFRGGDLVTNATGVLGEAFDLYRLQPTEGAEYTPVNPRTDAPEPVGGNVEVAAFNVLNYFTTLDSRGADTPEEFERQQAKIVAALTAIDADVFGLIEIENNTEAVANLVDALNAEVGAGTYAYVDTGVIGPDEIKQAFIYQPARVSLVGDYAVLDSDAFLDPNNLGEAKNRPALAQTFMDNDTGGIFTAVVNHFKSKGSSCGPGDDDPEAGSCDLTRTLAAQVLADWLATDPTDSGDDDFLIIGDLNSYDKENPIDVLEANGYTDLVFQYQGEYAYSYVFDGQFGYLDYGMANASLLPKVTGTTVWHINADEPDILDYDMSFKEPAQEQLFAVNPYRSSDHDPVIVGLDVCDEIAPTLEVTVTPDMLWPPNHQYVTVTPEIAVSDNFDPDPTVILLSVESNEPDNGLGDGDTPNDIVINDDGTIDLRAERSGTGDGRIYTLTYQATDDCGNSTTITATVTVPISRGR